VHNLSKGGCVVPAAVCTHCPCEEVTSWNWTEILVQNITNTKLKNCYNNNNNNNNFQFCRKPADNDE
jgi:hypothetical protein